MNYEKKYKEAHERAKEWSEGRYGHSVDDTPKDIAEYIFPELKESEDERIRKKIVAVIEDCLNIRPQLIEEVDYLQIKEWLKKQGSQILANSAKTCKDEQNPTDKIEPKFKVGDIIYRPSNSSCPVHSSIDSTICTVIEVLDEHYILDTNEGKIQEPFVWQDYYELVEETYRII